MDARATGTGWNGKCGSKIRAHGLGGSLLLHTAQMLCSPGSCRWRSFKFASHEFHGMGVYWGMSASLSHTPQPHSKFPKIASALAASERGSFLRIGSWRTRALRSSFKARLKIRFPITGSRGTCATFEPDFAAAATSGCCQRAESGREVHPAFGP